MDHESTAPKNPPPRGDAEEIAVRVVELLIPAISQMLRAASTASQGINPDAIYTSNAAAELIGLHPQTLNAKLRSGVIEGRRKHGGRWMIKGSELLRLAGPPIRDSKLGRRFGR
jgi:hypothetical protein